MIRSIILKYKYSIEGQGGMTLKCIRWRTYTAYRTACRDHIGSEDYFGLE
jgi:hypothetical protein